MSIARALPLASLLTFVAADARAALCDTWNESIEIVETDAPECLRFAAGVEERTRWAWLTVENDCADDAWIHVDDRKGEQVRAGESETFPLILTGDRRAGWTLGDGFGTVTYHLERGGECRGGCRVGPPAGHAWASLAGIALAGLLLRRRRAARGAAR